MAAEMHRMENAARLAMADLGADAPIASKQLGMSVAVKLGLLLASLVMFYLVATTLF